MNAVETRKRKKEPYRASRVLFRKDEGGPRTRPHRLNADKGYDSTASRRYLYKRPIKANIPKRKLPEGQQRRRKERIPQLDEEVYKNRNQLEWLFGKLKHFRRIATRYDKYAQVFLAFIKLGFILIYLRKYSSNTT
jgi:transposase